ncbi:MAG: methylenetetrahydrofolate reductase [Candidatus Omnitrophica bacterium]|nr:methylenetetrahydrofolate reductase [Candidatus Omnitrophota bacterium]MBU4488535.1 methylenetetrahydrofolate reductase [Candidatus Omnitrophota bacterium]MCG2705580.1 methylenetetrahydrofolate reductase [Candidatus Omnitrophota bacterium]
MTFSEKIKTKKFIVTSEIGPPKGVDVAAHIVDAELVKGRVDAINVTDLQSSVMRLGSLAFSRLLIERNIEPIYQVTCRDRNRLALQSDLLSAYALGIRNVLILTGDHPSLGDHPAAKPVYDLDSVGLLRAAKLLESGHDLAGKKLKGSPKFCLGAAVNPGVDPLEPEIIKMAKKIESGAEFFQTQAIFDAKQFEKFMNNIKDLKVPIIAGVVVLKSADSARFMNKHVPGISVPDAIIEEIEKAEDKDKKSIEIAARLIKELKGIAGGVHIMSIGMNKKVPLILNAAGL